MIVCFTKTYLYKPIETLQFLSRGIIQTKFSKIFSIFNNKPPASWAADIKRDFLACYSCLYYSSMIWPWNIKVYLLKYKRKLKGKKEKKQRMSFYKTQSTHWRVHSKVHHLKIATLRNSSSSLPLCHYFHCFFQPLASLFYSLKSM